MGNLFFNGGLLPQNEFINPFLVLHVRRENIVQDTLNQVIRLGPMEYKRPLQVLCAIISKSHALSEGRLLVKLNW